MDPNIKLLNFRDSSSYISHSNADARSIYLTVVALLSYHIPLLAFVRS